MVEPGRMHCLIVSREQTFTEYLIFTRKDNTTIRYHIIIVRSSSEYIIRSRQSTTTSVCTANGKSEATSLQVA